MSLTGPRVITGRRKLLKAVLVGISGNFQRVRHQGGGEANLTCAALGEARRRLTASGGAALAFAASGGAGSPTKSGAGAAVLSTIAGGGAFARRGAIGSASLLTAAGGIAAARRQASGAASLLSAAAGAARAQRFATGVATLTTFGTGGGSGPVPLPTITVDQASIRFPGVNERVTNQNGAAHIHYLRAPSHSPTTGTYLNNDQCFLFSLEVPWDELDGISTSNIFGVMGNLSSAILSPTTARTFGFMLGGKKHASIAGKIRAIFNSESGNSADWVAADLDISSYRRLLIAFRRVGSDFFFEAYHRGARVAQWTRAVGNFAATGSRITADYIIGCMGTAVVGSVPSASGALSGLVGSIGHVGLYVGTVAQADLEAISTGVHPLTQLTAANWRQYRDLTDTSSASLTKPSAATGDATAAFTAVGSAFERGSNILPVQAGAGWIEPNFIASGFVWGRLSGENARAVTFSGGASTSLAGETVEMRFFDEATGQLTRDWTAIGIIGGDGSWSGSINLPKNNGWGGADFRLASDPTKLHRLRSKVGVGLKFAVWGQSQLEIAMKAADMAKVPASNTALSQVFHDVALGIVTLKRSRPDRGVTDFAAVMADLCRTYTTEPICVVGYVKGGTGLGDLMDDTINGYSGGTGRQWSDVTLINGIAGTDHSASIINWATEEMGVLNMLEGYYDPFIRGDAPSGPLVQPYTVQHWLGDGTFQAGMKIVLSPLTRHTINTATAQDSSAYAAAGAARQAAYDYAVAYPGVLAAVGPSLDDMAIVSGGGPHEPTGVDEGPSRVARRLTVGLMRGVGLDTTVDPTVASADLTSGGATIDLTVTRPNGGAIQTAWSIKGVSVPVGATTVQGFEIQSGGAGAWSRSGFTAEIISGAAGTVRLTKSSGTWPAGTKIRYLANGPLDYGNPVEADKLYHGILYESGALEGGIGLPVRGLWTATL